MFCPASNAYLMQAMVFAFVQGDACLHIGHEAACARAPACLQAACKQYSVLTLQGNALPTICQSQLLDCARGLQAAVHACPVRR